MPFPQQPRKHRHRALFEARDVHRYHARLNGKPAERVPPGVILVFGRGWRRYLRERFGGPADPEATFFAAGRSAAVALLLGPGGPHVAIVLEELAALGGRRFVILGLAGSLQRRLGSGQRVVCEKALRDEGTSHHYAAPSRYAYPSPRLTRRLFRAVQRVDPGALEGPSWTTDAIYRETREELRRYRRGGVLTVEMEAATAFTVARHVGVQAAALFVVSDHLDDSGWEPRFHAVRKELHESLDLALAAVRPDPARGRAPTKRPAR